MLNRFEIKAVLLSSKKITNKLGVGMRNKQESINPTDKMQLFHWNAGFEPRVAAIKAFIGISFGFKRMDVKKRKFSKQEIECDVTLFVEKA
jgi:hypothetical protein